MADLKSILSENIPFTGISVVQVVFALIILLIGYIVSKIIFRAFNNGLRKTKLPELVIDFLGRFLNVILYAIIILLFLGALGIQVGSIFIGVSAIIGLILGFGMQDTLTNLTGGVWIAALRPIDKNEVVTVNGLTGQVSGVGIMATELLTPDNQFITIPNKLVWGSPIVNFTRMPTRRVDVNVKISYESDLNKAIKVAINLMKNNKMVLGDPQPSVATTELADSSVNIQLRAWTKTENYWTINGDITNGILEAFRKEDIKISYPQMELHLKKE
jgi:small conductance mechanosensitive channel